MRFRGIDIIGVRNLPMLLNSLKEHSNNLLRILNNGIKFEDQLDSKEKTQTDTGAADTEFSITHELGRVPVGYLVKKIDKGGVIYESGTAWTSETIYLKSTIANCNVTLYIY